jgi:hypothetical protein
VAAGIAFSSQHSAFRLIHILADDEISPGMLRGCGLNANC